MPCGLAWKCLKAFYQFELTISAVDLFGEVNRHRQLDDGEPEQRAQQRREVHLDDVPNRMHLLDVAHESGAELKSSWDCRKGVLKNRRLRVKWFLPPNCGNDGGAMEQFPRVHPAPRVLAVRESG